MMSNSGFQLWFYRAIGASFGVFFIVLLAASASEPGEIDTRLRLVDKLIHESSAARRIDDSSPGPAGETKRRAEELFAAAERAWRAGDREAAVRDLDAAVGVFREAVALAGADAEVGDVTGDVGRLRDSVEALAAAHARVAAEKGEQASDARLQRRVTDGLARADKLSAASRVDDAREALNETYGAVIVAIEQLRGGDTVVRELSFATPEDEFAYELDRNDTHRMLLRVLIEDKDGAQLSNRAQAFVSTAGELRDRAESSAEREDFATAIELLEKSTRELVRAIRSSGVFIPG